MPRYLKELRIDEVSSVDRGAGEGVKVVLTKRAPYLSPIICGLDALPEEVEAYLKREFSDKERQDAADSGAALPDGSYPIKNKQDLKNAIQAVGRAKNPAKAKAHIKSRARALGATDMLPDSWSKRAAEIIDFGAARRSVNKDFNDQLDDIETRERAFQLTGELGEAIYALNMCICSILDDGDVADKDAAIAESIAQFQTHVAGLSLEDTEKADMSTINADVQKQINDAVAAAVGKAVEQGKAAVAESQAVIAKLQDELVLAKMTAKHKAFYDSMSDDTEKRKFKDMTDGERNDAMDKAKKRAEDDPIYKRMQAENEDLRKRLEKIEGERELEVCKREAKEMGITREDAGQLLQKVKKGDPDALKDWNKTLTEHAQRLSKSRDEAMRLGKVFDELGDNREGRSQQNGGDAHGELTAKAAELRKTQPELTEAQAYEKVLLDPANAEIAKRERTERMNRINKVAA